MVHHLVGNTVARMSSTLKERLVLVLDCREEKQYTKTVPDEVTTKITVLLESAHLPQCLPRMTASHRRALGAVLIALNIKYQRAALCAM